MAFGEVVPAMQNKTVDCAVTGTLSGNLAKWHEVATHMIATPIRWGQIVYAVNSKTWTRMDPKVREFIDTEVKRLEKNVWDAAAQFTEQGYACNAGRPDCKLGTPGKMTLVQLSKADREQLQKVVKDVMLPKWASRCSAQCVNEFNATVGKTMNLTASK
jgi:TRAP-type C4-dicarboxylate transport system substrate-binding protein